jgi:hypothetical protein
MVAFAETFLYTGLAAVFSLFRFIFSDESFSSYYSEKNIIIFLETFSVVFISICITIIMGGTSIKESLNGVIRKSKKHYAISATMFVGGISGFSTYLLLSVF